MNYMANLKKIKILREGKRLWQALKGAFQILLFLGYVQVGGLIDNIPLKILSNASERVRFSRSAIWVKLAIAVGVRDKLIRDFNSSQKMGSPFRQAIPLWEPFRLKFC
jgi:hypothetical protein